MFGVILTFISTFFKEIGTAIGKRKVTERKESIFTMGFLNMIWGTIFFLFYAIFIRGEFILSPDSFPTLGLRAILEIIQAHVTMLAITRADRSTFGFLRIWTIPLILAVDVTLGYEIGTSQMLGISLIVLSFIILFINHGINKKGAWLVVFTAVNAVITISLFKYNITHFNSVEAEQSIIFLVLMLYFYLMARHIAKEKPIFFLKKPVFLIQSLTKGIAGVFMSFAYLFAPASIIATAKRSTTILWSILSGNFYFHEKKFVVKLISFIFIVVGLVLLMM